jgi:hypothetical protein
MSGADVFVSYLERFTSGDVNGAAELLADDFAFEGPMIQTTGKAEFLAGSSPLGSIMRGFEMRRQWIDGDEVCSVYDFKIETPLGAGSIPMAEWSVVRDGKIVSSHLVFDTAALTALVSAG